MAIASGAVASMAADVQGRGGRTCSEEHADLPSQEVIREAGPSLWISDAEQVRSNAVVAVPHRASCFDLQAAKSRIRSCIRRSQY